MNTVTCLFLAVFSVFSCSSLPLGPSEENTSLPDYQVLQEELLQTVEVAINHIVNSRDMHKALKRSKRQSNNFAGGLGQASGGLGSFGSGFGGLNGAQSTGGLGSGGLLDGLENFASLASLDALGSGAAANNAGPLAPVLQGIGSANNVVKTMVGLDRMRCVPRLTCEYMANRGLFNRTGAIISPAVLSTLPNNTQAALNISNPSTFRTVLGLLQLVRFQEFGAYPFLEAGLWGAAHRDNGRCRNQFTKCPSTSEAFISELNTTPGGLQGLFTNAIQSLRNSLPGIGSGGGAGGQPTRITSGLQSASNIGNLGNFGSLSNFGQQGSSSVGSLGALGNNFGNQQLFNPSSGFAGGSSTGLGAGSLANNLGSSFGNPSLSSSAFLNGLGTGSLGSLGSGTNFNQLNFANLGLNGAGVGAGSLGTLGSGTNLNQLNFANLGLNGAGLSTGSLGTLGSGTNLNQLNFANLGLNGAGLGTGSLGTLGSSTNLNQLNFANLGLNGASLGNPGQNGLLLNSLTAANGQNGLLSAAQLGGTQFSSLHNAQFGNLAGSNLGNFNFASNSFGSQLSPSTFQTGFGGFNGANTNFRSGLEGIIKPLKKEMGKKWKWSI